MKRANIVTYDVYVSNFNKTQSNDTVEKKVSKHFTQFGETKGIFVRDNNQGKYGVVKYLSEPDADRAVSESNGILLDGMPILVRRMERKTNKPPAGAGAGGGGVSGSGGGSGVVVTGGTWVATKDGTGKTQLGKNPDIVPAVEPTGSPSPGPEGETNIPAALWANRLPGSVLMYVTHVETPTLYWCQDLNETLQVEVENLRAKLAETCANAPTLQNRPEPGKIYGAKFSEDGEWYRCQLKMNSSGSGEKVKIQYIDYGNCEEVKFKDLVELPEEMVSVKPYAQKVMLHNTRYVGPKEREARKFLETAVLGQSCMVCPTFRLPDGTGQFAQLFTEATGNLNQYLIDKGYAVVKPPKQQQQHPQPLQSLQQPANEASPAHMSEGGGYNSGGSWGLGGDDSLPDNASGLNRGPKSFGMMQGRQVLGEPDSLRNSSSRLGGPSPVLGVGAKGGEKGSVLGDPPAHLGTAMMQGPGPAFTDLKIDLHNKQRALEKASAELSAERVKIKTLQQEFQGLVTRMEENNIVNQLKVVVSLAGNVRQLRAQFSWEQPTALDEALELACSEHKLMDDSVTSLPPLMATLNTYRSLQQEICQQDSTQVCEETVKERDTLRKTLYEQLCECITEMEGIPFTERAQSITKIQNPHTIAKVTSQFLVTLDTTIKQCTGMLMKNYENYFNKPVEPYPDFSTAVTQYQELKAKKQQDFEQAQKCSDQHQENIQAQLSAIGKSLSLTPEEERGDCDLDLIRQMKMYRASLQQEIAVRNVEDSQEGSFLASLVKAVHQDLKAEILCLNKLMHLQTEFTSMRDSIAPWLDNTPSLDVLLENRQTLRSLKSKLRHKLADKHDAEENEEREEVEEIQKEVEDIQTEIHNTLMVEEKQLEELATLVDQHFPEFLKLHPDSGLDLQLKYRGFVKSHHEISHYNLTPIPGANGRLFFSKFASKDIIVRECLLSDGHHLGQEEFLTQLMTYTDISHPALLAPTSVFFDKKNRHAYVCVEKGEGDILASCVQYNSISLGDEQSMVRSVVGSLSALHARKILHGEVNPFNILRYPDGTAALLPPDFSCCPTDRAKNKFTTASGLSFTAPELSNMLSGCEATGVVDMYSVGVLILYLSCREEGVTLTSADGSLDLSKLPLDSSAFGVVNNLLSQQPALRPTADMVLGSNYLRQHQSCDTSADRATPPSAASVSPAICTAIPPFSMPPMQRAIVSSSLPIMPPVNLQQPPPPLPPTYPSMQQDLSYSTPSVDSTAAESLARFSTPPPVDSFNSMSIADPAPFVDPNGSSTMGRNPSPFSGSARGDQAYETSREGFDSGASAYLPSIPGGFEEAALQQEHQENDSRGPLPTFRANPEPGFGMSGDHFEIGTFSIQDVNGAGDNAKGRKITRQPSAEERDKKEEEEDWPVEEDAGED